MPEPLAVFLPKARAAPVPTAGSEAGLRTGLVAEPVR